ncbi:hypothetical protein [Nocardioides antri]|uniref:Nuclear transport factor 2 family protein n=1 Tax=Nocardioides antri TaxID=2607659 RepID=A0A5B1M6A4_9ACTN|nr:hypothetical protein [Nocardioides antri]KAA1427210.1 hypothetical protein F0U47_06810 [Nocardioides antri]
MTSAALLLALAGCGDDKTTPEPNLGGSPTEESSATTPTSDATEATEPFDGEGDEVHAGRIKAGSPAEEAVGQAWVDYWQVRVTAYHKTRVDADALGRVARGGALQEVIDYVGRLQTDGTTIEGDTRVGVTDIEIAGSSAAVKSCLQSKAGPAGSGGDEETSYATIVGALVQEGQQWLVETITVTGDKRCTA